MTRLDSSACARTSLFVYGTLQQPETLRALIGRVPASRPARLSGFRRGLMKGRSYPGIVPAKGQCVDGRLLEGLTQPELQRLDDYEGEEYQRASVVVSLREQRVKPVTCDVYLVRKQVWERVTSEPFMVSVSSVDPPR